MFKGSGRGLTVAFLASLAFVFAPVALALYYADFANEPWQAAGAVATSTASIVALVAAGAAIYLELDSQRASRSERDAATVARRAVVRTLLVAELQDVLAAAMRLTDQLPGEFVGQDEVETRTAQQILDERYEHLRVGLTHIRNPITPIVAPMLDALMANDLDALNRITTVVGSMRRTPLEIARREGSRSGIALSVTELINELNGDNDVLIKELRALLDSWHIDSQVRALERVI